MAMTLQKDHGEKVEIKIFLLADAVFAVYRIRALPMDISTLKECSNL
jgi:hypothetical protein